MDPQHQLLHEGLHALLEKLQPNQDSDGLRREVVEDMQQLVAEALPPEFHCSVETFGSFRAGLHLPGSDLDFALSGWVLGPDQRQIELYEWNNLDQQYLLADLADVLEQTHLVQGQVERVLHARVPVIKFTHRKTGLACDVSINRPECCFKADMQKLLGSLDRRYASLYRLVKAWAAAHGLNDAAANTLNSWSLGLLVAFYLQRGTSPAVLPPIWQLLEKEAPDVRQPRVLQLPNVNASTLKRTFNLAVTGAGAYLGRRTREGPAAVNSLNVVQLLAGFFKFYAPVLTDWAEGRNGGWRASPWWGDWKQASWPGSKNYIFGIEDPFNAGDNTARAVGTHSHLSSCRTAGYIAATVTASHDRLQRALSSSSSGSSSSSSSSSDAGEPSQQGVAAAFAWLFGPHTLLQLGYLPNPLALQVQQQLPQELCQQLQQQLEVCQDCMELLSCSSGLVNKDNTSVTKDPARVLLIQGALELFRGLMQGLGCSDCHVCLGDYLDHRRQIEQQEAEQRERERQQQLRQHEDRRREVLQLQQLQAQSSGSGSGDWGTGEQAAGAQLGRSPPMSQQQQQQAVLAAMQGLHVSRSGGGGGSSSSSVGQRRHRPDRRGAAPGREHDEQVLAGYGAMRSNSSSSGGGGGGVGGRRASGSGSRGNGSWRQGSSPPDVSSQRSQQQQQYTPDRPAGAKQQQQQRWRAEEPAGGDWTGSAGGGTRGGAARAGGRQPAVAAAAAGVGPAGGSRLAATALAGVMGGGKGHHAQRTPPNGYVHRHDAAAYVEQLQ